MTDPPRFELIDNVPEELTCRIRGEPLLGDPDDQPYPPLGPMCGDCYRNREFDETIWEAEWNAGDGP